VFWYIKEAIDAYFDGRPFQVTVKAGCIIGKKLDQTAASSAALTLQEIELDELDETGRGGFEEVDTDLPAPPRKMPSGSVQVADPDDLEVEEIAAGDASDFEIDVDSPEEQQLDAFIEGRKRPPHLDE
jgi:hypothetical protein